MLNSSYTELLPRPVVQKVIAAALGRAWVPAASKHSQYCRFEKVVKSVTIRIMDLGNFVRHPCHGTVCWLVHI